MSDLTLALIMLASVGAGYVLGHVHALALHEIRRWRAMRRGRHE